MEGHIPLVFHLKYFLFSFFVNSQIIWLAVCTSNFFQAIFLHVVSVLFTSFGTCLSSSTGFPMMSIFLAFEAPQGSWDVLLNSLKTIADLQLLGSTGLVKCQDVSVGLDSLIAFSDGDSFYICNSLFSKGWCYLLFCSQCQLLTPDNSLGSVEFLMWVGSAFCRIKVFHFWYVVCLPPAVHLDKQVAIHCFLNSFRSSPCRNDFCYEERREFGEADLQRFNSNESGEVCCFILRVWFWEV